MEALWMKAIKWDWPARQWEEGKELRISMRLCYCSASSCMNMHGNLVPIQTAR